MRYLSSAKKLGQTLVLGLNSDSSVRKLKGPSRPLNDQDARAEVLLALKSVDIVCIFNEDTPLNLIEIVKPNVLVKGGDYQNKLVVGQEFVESHGGRVELISFVEGYSTTQLIERSRQS